MTFGFIINPDEKSQFGDIYGNWLEFLEDDFSAVFTDCINSVVELDANCNFCNYISITQNNNIDSYKLSNFLPIRFSNIIEKNIAGKNIGIFLLNNGDIILSKAKEIHFVKRNNKWLNFNYKAFENSINNKLKFVLEENLLKNVYSSILDVSFSHTGGIIAITNLIEKLITPEKDDFPILNHCDYLLNSMSFQDIKDKFDEQNNEYQKNNNKHLVIKSKEISKRILKRKVIKALILDQNFINIDRKLRSELISLDGACILNEHGDVCAAGAIIKNDSGSSGGGRGAATKKLSRYGMAVKISTDGYIELFINGEAVYVIK